MIEIYRLKLTKKKGGGEKWAKSGADRRRAGTTPSRNPSSNNTIIRLVTIRG